MGHRPKEANVISHVGFVVDESQSIEHYGLTEAVKEQVLHQIRAMVAENVEKSHEIRCTLYTFQGDHYARDRDQYVHCVLADMDVLRMQDALTDDNLKDWYQPGGMTALRDATVKAIAEMKEYPTRYGKHRHLVWVISDGLENVSVTSVAEMRKVLDELDDETWDVGVLVPNQQAKKEAIKAGFREDNVLLWDTTKDGLKAASGLVQSATSTVLRSHRTGEKRTGGLFSTGAEAVNVSTVRDAGLTPVPKGDYERLYAHQKERMDELVRAKSTDLPYVRWNGFYQLTKRETIQASKKLLVWDRQKKVMLQGNVRALLNLAEGVDVTIPKPQDNDRYEVYVQSGADNRVVPEGKHGVIVRDHTKLAS